VQHEIPYGAKGEIRANGVRDPVTVYELGLAPPNPANVLDDATWENDTIFVRNVGCDGLDTSPVLRPGRPPP